MRISDWSSDVCSSDLLDILASLFFNLYTDFRVQLHIQVYRDGLLRGRHLDRRRAGGEGEDEQDTSEGRAEAAIATQSLFLPLIVGRAMAGRGAAAGDRKSVVWGRRVSVRVVKD